MNKWLTSGTPWVWLTAGAVSISLISVLGLLLLIAWRGLSYFWPADIYQWQVTTSDNQTSVVIGELYDRERVPKEQLVAAGHRFDEQAPNDIERFLIKTGNRELQSLDFQWVLATNIDARTRPLDLAVFERVKHGNFYGYPKAIIQDGQRIESSQLEQRIQQLIEKTADINAQADFIQSNQIGSVNWALERLRLEQRRYLLKGELTESQQQSFDARKQGLQTSYLTLERQLTGLRQQLNDDAVIVEDMRGVEVRLPVSELIRVSYNNRLSTIAKLKQWLQQVIQFISQEPRESNTEGGVFPAIFGTVFMVLLMAVMVTPFGVIAAVYLHEYAKKGPITRMIRVAVINLAGVPSIVYGVFGLGFFVYVLGGSIDALFYSHAMPSPTFGTPGILWSALTLAILTLPVVIVSTEEGLSRIPPSLRQASLALGATRAETLFKIVLPMASPAIMTGLILAIARAAGEVAPLMLVGVVKLAPSLPIDGHFPFVHLDRKFMHLGFHIYDVGFQSPNVEAARPLVYATSFLLVSVIVSLNLTAIAVRNHLREKFRAMEQ
ncbi:phosphate ABC transporter permease PstA [Paraferrimonas haliotis]|uniref:Phosphate transport system permease protein PstA n=1 Tax=Paraferrimonas haliotis TaxID=2013866 RepID=A0AA37TWK1_9GAMM|nr:phosphate ABC transporter permease PstA [Paraferrimonas haliotis]GLS82946.1 phosphate transport system permease protein PstA [Paraferrimonas haliotis]